MPRKGRKRKKTRTHVVEDFSAQSALASSDALKIPRSAVVSKYCCLYLCLSIYPGDASFHFILDPYSELFFTKIASKRYEEAKQSWKWWSSFRIYER